MHPASSSNLQTAVRWVYDYELEEPVFEDTDYVLIPDAEGLPKKQKNVYLRSPSDEVPNKSEASLETKDLEILNNLTPSIFLLQILQLDFNGTEDLHSLRESTALLIGPETLLACAHPFIITGDWPVGPKNYVARLRKSSDGVEICRVIVEEYGCAPGADYLLPRGTTLCRDDDWVILKAIEDNSLGSSYMTPTKTNWSERKVVKMVGYNSSPSRSLLRASFPPEGRRVSVDDDGPERSERFIKDPEGVAITHDISCTPAVAGSAIVDEEGRWVGMHVSGGRKIGMDGRVDGEGGFNWGIMVTNRRLGEAMVRVFGEGGVDEGVVGVGGGLIQEG